MSQMTCELPQKMFYRIQEVSRITGVKSYVLRYWETEFPSLRPEKGPNDQRRYRPRDIELIQRIKQLLYDEKFTIAGARQRIESEDSSGTFRQIAASNGALGQVSARPSFETLARRVGEIRQAVVELQAFLAG